MDQTDKSKHDHQEVNINNKKQNNQQIRVRAIASPPFIYTTPKAPTNHNSNNITNPHQTQAIQDQYEHMNAHDKQSKEMTSSKTVPHTTRDTPPPIHTSPYQQSNTSHATPFDLTEREHFQDTTSHATAYYDILSSQY
jgi:hypothetical protein